MSPVEMALGAGDLRNARPLRSADSSSRAIKGPSPSPGHIRHNLAPPKNSPSPGWLERRLARDRLVLLACDSETQAMPRRFHLSPSQCHGVSEASKCIRGRAWCVAVGFHELDSAVEDGRSARLAEARGVVFPPPALLGAPPRRTIAGIQGRGSTGFLGRGAGESLVPLLAALRSILRPAAGPRA